MLLQKTHVCSSSKMPQFKKRQLFDMIILYMTKKRIYNPKTGKYYKLRERTTSEGKKGQILGGYHPNTAKKISKKFGRAIKRLSDT